MTYNAGALIVLSNRIGEGERKRQRERERGIKSMAYGSQGATPVK